MNQILQVESGPRRLLTTVRALLLPLLLTWLLLPAPVCHAGTPYYIPADLTAAPFNCVMATATIYDCSGSMYLDKDIDLYLTSDVTLRISGNLTSEKNLTTINNGHTLQATVSGNVEMKKDTRVTMDIAATGAMKFAKNARITGNLQANSSITFSKDTTVNGNLVVGGDLNSAKNVTINGTCTVMGTNHASCTGGTPALHHVRVNHTGSTTTCGRADIIITACASGDSNGSCTLYTGGVSGTLVAEDLDGTDLATVSFTIPTSGTYSTSLPAITSEQTASFTFTDVSKSTAASGTCWNGSTDDCDLVVSSCGVHHVRLDHGGAGVTCVPASVTVNACSGADSGGACTASTSGISGNVVARSSGGAVLATVPFSISAGNSSATIAVPVTTAQTATLDTSGLSVTPGGIPVTTCWTGNSTSCDYVFADSGFVFDIPNHVAGTTQIVDFKAVKKANNSNACQPTLPNGSYEVDFSCNYSDPNTGTQNATVSYGGTSKTLACGTGATSKLAMKFTDGLSSLEASYPDAGEIKLSATFTGANTGTVTGNDFFIAAPAKFVVSTTTSPLQADVAFNAKVTAVNFNGGTMANFGKESDQHHATLAFSKCGGAYTGVFSDGLSTSGIVNLPAFSSGSSTATNLKYSEVGTLDATATMTTSGYVTPSTYMKTGLAVTGTTNTTASPGCSGAFGTFAPFYLVTALEPATTKFAYSGVPFNITVTAKNGSGNATKNYQGTYAKDIDLSAVTVTGTAVAATVGALSGKALATSFVDGVGTATPTFTFSAVTGGVNGTKPEPQTIYLRAKESGGTASSSTPPGFPPLYETSALIRYGRLRLFNAYGTSLTSVKMPVQAEYWNGTVWVVNGDDKVTKIPATAIGFPAGGTTVANVVASDTTLVAGKGTITITKNSKVAGWTYVTAKLGPSSSHSDTCAGSAGGVTAADLAGLRSYYGCGTGGYDYDPLGRANFGIQSQETKGIVHVREVFN